MPRVTAEKVRANVGFLSTATALYPRLTAQELVEYFGRLNGLDEATLKKRVDDLFNRLDHFLYRAFARRLEAGFFHGHVDLDRTWLYAR